MVNDSMKMKKVISINDGEARSHLKTRGLSGVRLCVSDKCIVLVKAIGECFPSVRWQRCVYGSFLS